MSSIPSNIARVSNLLSSRQALGRISRTNVDILNVIQQITTGRAILRPSDNVVRATAISTLDDRLEYSQQRNRNLSHATAALGVLDNTLAEANTIALQAKSIASDQLGPTSSAAERNGQASIVDQMLRSLFNTANREGVAGYVFGGSRTSIPPVIEQNGGFRFTSNGPGLVTDLGQASTIPITLGAGNAVVATSGRVRGSVDFNPNLTLETRLADLAGTRGLGISPGAVRLSINGTTPIEVDFTTADTARDVADRVTNAIRAYETANTTTILGPAGVTAQGNGFAFDLVSASAGPPAIPAASLNFFDIGQGTTAQDLGLVTTPATTFNTATPNGGDTRPNITLNSPITSLIGITGPLGSIRISNSGRSAIVDLSAETTIEDVKNAIEGTNLGVRVSINSTGSGIDVLNDLSATSDQSLSISEVGGNNTTATRLGIRSFSGETRINDLNFGRGVQVLDQVTDPITGLYDAALSSDFVIELGDAGQTKLTIDLRPQDMGTIQSVLNRINSQAAPQLAAAGLPATAFFASLGDGANGIRLSQDPTFSAALTVGKLNNSPAAEQLGLTKGTFDVTSGALLGEDRGKIRVDGLFTDLLDLQAALRSNNSVGIALAGERVETSLSSLTESRGLVGSYAARVDSATVREQDRIVLDETVRSQLRDVDYAEASTRYSLLQTQLQAALQTTAQSQSRSLLDFLG